MARLPRFDLPNTAHHIFSRGNGKQRIFLDDEDRSFFVRRLADLAEELKFQIYAYCLMDNHFHLAIQRTEVAMRVLMHRLLTAYARVFNDRWDVVGHTFQGRYGNRVVRDDRDLMGVIRYIHANPVAAGMVQRPIDWHWSGHAEIVRGQKTLIDMETVLDLFGGLAHYEEAMSQPAPVATKTSLDDLAEGISTVIRSIDTSRHASKARRLFIGEALAAGYRRAEIARYLNRSPGAVTKLLARNVNVED